MKIKIQRNRNPALFSTALTVKIIFLLSAASAEPELIEMTRIKSAWLAEFRH